MRVLVVGGYGLIGGYVVTRLAAGGHDVTGLGRAIAMAGRRFPQAAWVRADLRDLRTPADWTPLLNGSEAVVNCAGALQDSPRDDVAAVQARAATALFEACAAAQVRLVHISAAGVAPGAPTRFFQTKADAEADLKGLDLDWTILRPAFVLAPTAYGASALLRGLAAFPGFIPALYPDAIVQVVSVLDVAEAVARALEPGAPARIVLDLADPAPTRLRDILTALRAWLGLAPAPVLAIPPVLARLAGWASDAIALLGWRSPMRSTAIAQLKAGVTADPPSGLATLAEMLAAWPAGVQERWFARAYVLKPAMLVVLAGFWTASGLIALTVGHAAALATAKAALPAGAAEALVDGGAVVDIALGLSAGVRALAGLALKGMVGVSAVYLIGASVLAPALWSDPLGPLVKVVPTMLLALAALALLDER
ncbi:MAG TPA: NAD(P)H-binding protein [Caulobacteraceae bacterium]|nr:NAD(P)H-binding protein [Caulobacteraceae bacterium]